MRRLLAFVLILAGVVARSPNAKNIRYEDDRYMHSISRRPSQMYVHPVSTAGAAVDDYSAEYWRKKAQSTLNEKLSTSPIKGQAKNIILFLGDGMSIPTLAASRVYLGQKTGRKNGEELELSFEKFPYAGLSKTYCVDSQVADSACSATAYLCGIKANIGTSGVTSDVPPRECAPMLDEANHAYSIARWSQLAGKKTGLVTTTRVTHASPSAVYAHTAYRSWENDHDVGRDEFNASICRDIAYQLVHGETGKELNVIFGGGRRQFFSEEEDDEEGFPGSRQDGQDLLADWKAQKEGKTYEYVWNKTQLDDVPLDTDYVLGLFESDDCKFNLDREVDDEDPTIEEMTAKAIELLSTEPKGYFLFVEGGRIDHGHHWNLAKKAFDETVEFSKAIERAVNMTNREDTLIVVTSDHAHVMTLNGYPARGNDIFGISYTGMDHIPIATITYANGPSYRTPDKDGRRHDITNDDRENITYGFPSAAPTIAETHGGDDVGVFSIGPWAHLLTGVFEQNLIPHIMAYAACVGDGLTVCNEIKKNEIVA